MTRRIPSAAAAVVAAALATSALAASTSKNPKTLALRTSDFPAGAQRHLISDNSGSGGKVYSAAFSFGNGGREEEVTALVFVSKNAADAKGIYASYVGQNSGFKGETALRLTAYGDEQVASWASYTGAGGATRARAALVVRKNTVVWTLTIENCGTLSPFGCYAGPRPPKISEAQAVADLTKYAPKQKGRVGAG